MKLLKLGADWRARLEEPAPFDADADADATTQQRMKHKLKCQPGDAVSMGYANRRRARHRHHQIGYGIESVPAAGKGQDEGEMAPRVPGVACLEVAGFGGCSDVADNGQAHLSDTDILRQQPMAPMPST